MRFLHTSFRWVVVFFLALLVVAFASATSVAFAGDGQLLTTESSNKKSPGISVVSTKAVSSYSYTVAPLLAPFNTYIYVKTNNPDPYSFRLVDKSSKYFASGVDTTSGGRGVFHLVEKTFLDVKYEKLNTYRVPGGYIFFNYEGQSDGGQLIVQEAVSSNPARITYGSGYTSFPGDINAGWKDTNIKVMCSTTKDYIDYAIDTYSDSSMGFFDKLDAIENGLAKIAYYPRRVLDSSKAKSDMSHPFFATSPYVELGLNKHYDIYEADVNGLLITRVYPFILDSASFPGTMAAIAQRLDSSCTVTSVQGMHWLIEVSKNGTTKNYGWGTPSGNNPIFSKRAVQNYSFNGSASDFGTQGTISKLLDQLRKYGQLADGDAKSLEDQLAAATVARSIAPGGWVRVATEGWGYGTTFSYLALGPDGESYMPASNAWVDGRYVNEYETLDLEAVFADHPKADIILRNQTYTDRYGMVRTSDIVYNYDSATDTWRAPYYYFAAYGYTTGTELPEQFILTRAQVEALRIDKTSKHIPEKGYVYDGTKKPGTPFSNVLVTGITLANSLELVTGTTQVLTAAIKPSNATDKRVYWTSSDESIVAVRDGSVTGVKKGTAIVTARTSDGDYMAKCSIKVVDPINISKASVTGVANQTYTGKALTPNPTVKLGSTTLKKGADYTLSYKNNVNAGTATLVITGKGKYTGTAAKTFKIYKWKRLFGANQMRSMQAIVQEGWRATGGTVVIANMGGYRDALSVSGAAGLEGAPIILTSGTKLSPQTKEELLRLKPTKVIVAGGTGAINETVFNQIKSTSGANNVIRIWGETAPKTAVALNNAYANKWNKEGIALLAHSNGWRDSASAASIAYAKHYPVYLAEKNGKVSADTVASMKKCGIKEIIILGGTLVIPNQTVKDLIKQGFTVKIRLGGKDAVETSQKVVNWAITKGMKANNMAVISFGSSRFREAFPGAALCGKNGSLMVMSYGAVAANTEIPARYKAYIQRGYILGDIGAISDSVYSAFEAATS